MSAPPPLAAPDLPATVRMRRGRIVFPARRPAALVIPLAAITELAGAIIILTEHSSIGWFICAAPLTLLATAAQRPTLELTRDGLVQRQYPFASLTRWEVIAEVGLTRAGNRSILAYRLTPGTPPPKRQPAAALLRAAQRPYDGGFFADSLAPPDADVLLTVQRYLRHPELRSSLPEPRH
ncbi:MAG: hypothetical protein NVSMB29_19260 [Candidatus Dormibacteria bacterium]